MQEKTASPPPAPACAYISSGPAPILHSTGSPEISMGGRLTPKHDAQTGGKACPDLQPPPPNPASCAPQKPERAPAPRVSEGDPKPDHEPHRG